MGMVSVEDVAEREDTKMNQRQEERYWRSLERIKGYTDQINITLSIP